MNRFLPYDDELAKQINSAADELLKKLQQIDADALGMPDYCLYYFKASHTTRLFFSIETSAHILYRSIKLCNKNPDDVVFMDYGAGVGTLFLLAKLIGCKKVVYSDHLDDWRKSAALIANAINIHIDHFIVGDIGDCVEELSRLNVQCDIIASRNVIEHIYKLDEFYTAIHRTQKRAIVFSSTTANRSNPAALIKHQLWHKKWEKVYRGKRLQMIDRLAPGMLSFRKNKLARATRGLAASDLEHAVEQYRQSGHLPDPAVYGTNTCDPDNGVWAEHIISMPAYRNLIGDNFDVSFAPGFWDTHYHSAYKNRIATMLNKVISRGGSIAMMLAPFMYVIARPKQS